MMIKEELFAALRPMHGLADEAIECLLPLKQKCKGALNGVSWAEGKVPAVSILQHAAGTLLKLPAQALEAMVSKADAAHGRLTSEIGRHGHLFGGGKAAWTLDLDADKRALLESVTELKLN